VAVGLSKPTQGAFTNDLRVEVKVSATGASVAEVRLEYSGVNTGSLPLAADRGVWVGQLPPALPSGQYTLKARAKLVGSGEIREGPSVSFTLDRELPELTILQAPSSLPAQGAASIRVRATDAISGIQEIRLLQGQNVVSLGDPVGNDEFVLNINVGELHEGIPLILVARDRAGNEKRQPLSLFVDRQAPTVVWRQPADGAQVLGTVTLEVEATDNVGVAKVEFFGMWTP